MIDIRAPIVPGKLAAGISIGGLVKELRTTVTTQSTTKLSSGERYDLDVIKLWVKNGVITQICVRSGYRGVLENRISIGSTIGDVEERFGCSVEEDEEDNLIAPNSPGWCFETEEWAKPYTVSNNRNAKITSISVFKTRK